MKNDKSKEKKRRSLEREIFMSGQISNPIFAVITIALCIVIANIPAFRLVPVIVSSLITCLVLNLIVFPIANKLVTQSASEELDSFYYYETSEKERTILMKKLMSMPSKIGLEVFTCFFLGGSIFIYVTSLLVSMESESIIILFATLFVGSYSAAVYDMSEAQKTCSTHACNIVKKGISKAEVEENHYFGTKSASITVVHIFAPIIIVNIFFLLIAWRSCKSYINTNLLFSRLFIISIVSIIFYSFFSTMLFKRMMHSILNMRHILEGMDKENLHKVEYVPTDLSNEFMYNVHLINTIIEILQKILKESMRISMEVVESSNELSVISNETSSTSLEQASGIKELLSAMEETDSLAKNISEKISEVSLVAKRTTENINDGFDILRKNMQKLDEIKQANAITLDGIKVLTEKVSGISDIARIINSIADQTNIIAFNAELEASSAGAEGQNFALVANEIRRLTNSTIQSTNEIRQRIIEIQHSSENLLAASQEGNKKILEGNQIVEDLNVRFEELKVSSETADSASESIKQIIEQQTVSFAQIVVTLRQISEAAETFSDSTRKISQSATNLCLVSDKLRKLQPEDESSQANISTAPAENQENSEANN